MKPVRGGLKDVWGRAPSQGPSRIGSVDSNVMGAVAPSFWYMNPGVAGVEQTVSVDFADKRRLWRSMRRNMDVDVARMWMYVVCRKTVVE